MNKAPDVVNHGCVTSVTRALVVLAEAVSFKEAAQGDIVAAVEIHADNPISEADWSMIISTQCHITRVAFLPLQYFSHTKAEHKGMEHWQTLRHNCQTVHEYAGDVLGPDSPTVRTKNKNDHMSHVVWQHQSCPCLQCSQGRPHATLNDPLISSLPAYHLAFKCTHDGTTAVFFWLLCAQHVMASQPLHFTGCWVDQNVVARHLHHLKFWRFLYSNKQDSRENNPDCEGRQPHTCLSHDASSCICCMPFSIMPSTPRFWSSQSIIGWIVPPRALKSASRAWEQKTLLQNWVQWSTDKKEQKIFHYRPEMKLCGW